MHTWHIIFVVLESKIARDIVRYCECLVKCLDDTIPIWRFHYLYRFGACTIKLLTAVFYVIS